TACTILRGVHGWHSDDSTASICCFAFKEGTECCPPRIADALGEVMVPYQVGDPHILQIDDIVSAHHQERGLVVKGRALPLHHLVLPLQQVHRLAAALAALLPAAHPALGFGKLFLCFAVVPWVLDTLALGGDEKHLEAHVSACLTSGRWHRFGGHFG